MANHVEISYSHGINIGVKHDTSKYEHNSCFGTIQQNIIGDPTWHWLDLLTHLTWI